MKGLLLGLVVAVFLFVGSASNVNAQCGDSCSCAPVRSAVKSVLKNTACAWDKMRPVRRVARCLWIKGSSRDVVSLRLGTKLDLCVVLLRLGTKGVQYVVFLDDVLASNLLGLPVPI